MSDVMIKCSVVPDDGSDGYFWRDGERWLRTSDGEEPVKNYAPNLEARFMMNLLAGKEDKLNLEAYQKSMEQA